MSPLKSLMQYLRTRRPRGALLLPGATPMSGKLGPNVYAHNRGGQYVRARTVPTNPNSTRQGTVRAIMGYLSAAWANILTAAQRTAWKTYADNQQRINRIGSPITLAANAMFVAENSIRQVAGLAVAEDGPTTFTRCGFNPVSMALTASGSSLTITGLNASDEWQATGGGLLVFTSTPQSPTINFFKGPYQYVNKLAGGTTTLTGGTITGVPVGTAGQKIFVRVVATAPDGRSSPEVLEAVTFQ